MSDEGAARAAQAALHAIRRLDALSRADAGALGDEAADLACLVEAAVPVCAGWIVPVDVAPEDVLARLEASLGEPPRRRTTRGSQPPPPPSRACLRFAPWFRTAALATRAAPRWPEQPDVFDASEVAPRLTEVLARARALGAALGASPGSVWVRILRCDEGPAGSASSVSVADGDPSEVAVWLPGRAAWTLDRKTMRVVEPGQGALARSTIERVADLADRAQLALGKPVEIDWALSGDRVVVTAVRAVSSSFCFTDETSRLVSLLWHDEGPIAPLAVDALDKALREDTDATDEVRVRRVFARAYRRVEPGRGRRGERTHPLGQAAVRAARVFRDVASPIAATRAFVRTLDDRLASFDADDLRALDDVELLRALRERQRVVIEAEQLLDRSRKATSAVIGTIEAALGTVPRECVDGLAAIRRTRARRRIDDRLANAARDLGELPRDLDALPPASRSKLDELRRELGRFRPLGLDVRPAAYGASDAALLEGMRAALEGRAERAEQAQRDALRRLMATARARPLGGGRAALVRALAIVIERLAEAKGTVAEGLSAAHLRVREVAIEIGRRLVERGVLDEPEDALYLDVGEIQEALSNEPGAYNARVRLRREEDARWRSFDPPERLVARSTPRRPTWGSAAGHAEHVERGDGETAGARARRA